VCQGFLAYNGKDSYTDEYSSDLKFAFALTPRAPDGKIVIRLGKYNRTYRAEINFDDTCRIIDESNNDSVLTEKQLPKFKSADSLHVSFSLVDHKFELIVGDHNLQHLGPDTPEAWGYDPKNRQFLSSVQIAVQGDPFILENVILYRDVHYTSSANGQPGRATEGRPFTLQDDEFYVLGDNSPQAHDSRFWDTPYPLSDGTQYRAGIVPRNYLFGPAYKIYWPPERSGPLN